MLKGLPRRLKQNSLLWIIQLGFHWVDIEERRVHCIRLVDKPGRAHIAWIVAQFRGHVRI
jgi:hypothetical protein